MCNFFNPHGKCLQEHTIEVLLVWYMKQAIIFHAFQGCSLWVMKWYCWALHCVFSSSYDPKEASEERALFSPILALVFPFLLLMLSKRIIRSHAAQFAGRPTELGKCRCDCHETSVKFEEEEVQIGLSRQVYVFCWVSVWQAPWKR